MTPTPIPTDPDQWLKQHQTASAGAGTGGPDLTDPDAWMSQRGLGLGVSPAGAPGRTAIGTAMLGGAPGPPPSPMPAGLAAPKPISIPLRNSQGPVKPKDVPLSGPEIAATAPLRFLAGGAQQLGQGMTQVSHPSGADEFAGGVSNIVRGGATLATPFAGPAMVAAPFRTAVGLGAGALGGAIAEGGARMAGAPEGTSQLIGTAAGAAAGYGGMRAGGAAADALTAKFSTNPTDLLTRAIKPSARNTQFTSTLSRSIPELKVSEQELGKPIESVQDLLSAVKIAKDRVWNQYIQIAGPRAQANVDLTPVADAMVRSIPAKFALEHPEAAQQIIALSDTYRRSFPIQRAEQLLSDTNAELKGYYASVRPDQTAALKANPQVAYREAQGTALRDAIYNALDAEGEGAAPRELKLRYGALSNLEREALLRFNVSQRQQPTSLSEGIGQWAGTGNIASGVFKTVIGNPLAGMADIARGVTEKQVSAYIKQQQNADALIKRAFAKYSGYPAPITMPAPFQPSGLLTTGDRITPPPPDRSSVRGVPAMPQPPTSRRALPGPSTLVPPPPPDRSGGRTTTGSYPDIESQTMTKVWDPARKTYVWTPKVPGMAHGGIIHHNTPPALGKPGPDHPSAMPAPPSPAPSPVPSQFSRKGGIDRIMTSDLPPARSTAASLHKHTGAKVAYSGNGLHAWHTGNTTPTDLSRYITKRPNAKPPGSGTESFNHFKRRGLGFVQKLLSDHTSHPREVTVAVTHGHLPRLIRSWSKRGFPPSMEIDTREMTSRDPIPSVHRLSIDSETRRPSFEPVDMHSHTPLRKRGTGGVYITSADTDTDTDT